MLCFLDSLHAWFINLYLHGYSPVDVGDCARVLGLLLTFDPCSQVRVLAGACQPLLRQLRLCPRPGHQCQRQ